jgi:polyisoprenoid-binding protein YceI
MLLLSLFAVNLAAAPVSYRVEPVNGTVSFTINKWSVIKEEGTFRDFNATIVFDRNKPAQSSVTFTVKTASVDTKNNDRDGTLRSDNFFDVKKHPTMTFRSTRVVPRADGVADVTGQLTIRGVTRQITVPVRFLGVSRSGNMELAGFETSFRIDRRHFGVTGGRWTAAAPGVLGNEVTIRIMAGGVSR